MGGTIRQVTFILLLIPSLVIGQRYLKPQRVDADTVRVAKQMKVGTYFMPLNNGTVGQVLTTDGSGNASWNSTVTTETDPVWTADSSSYYKKRVIDYLLGLKENKITAGTSSQYWRGDKTWQTFPAIPAAQVQSDYGQTNSSSIDFIKRKPWIPLLPISQDSVFHLTDTLLHIWERLHSRCLPEANSLFDRMTMQPDDFLKEKINKAIDTLKVSGAWDKLIGFYVYAVHDEQAATLNWKGSIYNLTEKDYPYFTRKIGFTSYGGALRTGFIPSSMGGTSFTTSNACMGIGLVSRSGIVSQDLAGVAVTSFDWILDNGMGTYTGYLNTFTSLTTTSLTAPFLIEYAATSLTNVQYSVNGIYGNQVTKGTNGLPTYELYGLNMNRGGEYYDSHFISYGFYFGSSMTRNQSLSIYHAYQIVLQ